MKKYSNNLNIADVELLNIFVVIDRYTGIDYEWFFKIASQSMYNAIRFCYMYSYK